MLLGSFLFAIMGVMANCLGQSCDWQVIALARCTLALLFTLILIALFRVRLAVFKPRILWVRSLAGSVSMVCCFYALAHLPVSDVLTLTNMFPLWVALLSWPLEGEAPTPGLWLAILCGVAGVALIQQPHMASGNWATLAAIVGSFFTAIAMLGLNKIKGVDHYAIVAHFSAVATVVAFVALVIFEHGQPVQNHFTGTALLLLLGVGVMATFGQIFLTKAFSAGEPTRVSVVGLTQIVFAMILGAAFLRHSFDWLRILGTVLVVAPTGWVMLHRRLQDHVVAPVATVSVVPHRKVAAARLGSVGSAMAPIEGVAVVPGG